MNPPDLRNVNGRLLRLLIAAPIGLIASLAITLALPTRDHFPVPNGGCGFSHQDQGWLVTGGSPSLMLVGACAIAFGVYVVLNAIGSFRRRQLAYHHQHEAPPRVRGRARRMR